MLGIDWKGRLVRFGTVTGSMVVPALLAVLVSQDFRDAMQEAFGSAPLVSIIYVALVGVATQLVGHLIIRRPPPPDHRRRHGWVTD